MEIPRLTGCTRRLKSLNPFVQSKSLFPRIGRGLLILADINERSNTLATQATHRHLPRGMAVGPGRVTYARDNCSARATNNYSCRGRLIENSAPILPRAHSALGLVNTEDVLSIGIIITDGLRMFPTRSGLILAITFVSLWSQSLPFLTSRRQCWFMTTLAGVVSYLEVQWMRQRRRICLRL
ncbi:uncharacterized protein ARMOST_21141 [Armillaria ostoyae]|uniref:Uncharacterized protein n=1 Tax=Armillaria ostoyae TaxID=47428 RepID=A0A284S9C0_ARMOS|nr:uncharacterized protein ARMOST_21141 [Armillaria ostoyae]